MVPVQFIDEHNSHNSADFYQIYHNIIWSTVNIPNKLDLYTSSTTPSPSLGLGSVVWGYFEKKRMRHEYWNISPVIVSALLSAVNKI